ncbi:hypothetical protein Dimus_006111 [Dionaea muscipula]
MPGKKLLLCREFDLCRVFDYPSTLFANCALALHARRKIIKPSAATLRSSVLKWLIFLLFFLNGGCKYELGRVTSPKEIWFKDSSEGPHDAVPLAQLYCFYFAGHALSHINLVPRKEKKNMDLQTFLTFV